MKQLTALDAVTSAKNFSRVPTFARLFLIRFGKLRPTSYWCFSCPHESMAPVLEIASMVARAFSVSVR